MTVTPPVFRLNRSKGSGSVSRSTSPPALGYDSSPGKRIAWSSAGRSARAPSSWQRGPPRPSPSDRVVGRPAPQRAMARSPSLKAGESPLRHHPSLLVATVKPRLRSYGWQAVREGCPPKPRRRRASYHQGISACRRVPFFRKTGPTGSFLAPEAGPAEGTILSSGLGRSNRIG